MYLHPDTADFLKAPNTHELWLNYTFNVCWCRWPIL